MLVFNKCNTFFNMRAIKTGLHILKMEEIFYDILLSFSFSFLIHFIENLFNYFFNLIFLKRAVFVIIIFYYLRCKR